MDRLYYIGFMCLVGLWAGFEVGRRWYPEKPKMRVIGPIVGVIFMLLCSLGMSVIPI